MIMTRYKKGYWQDENNIKSELIEWHQKVGVEKFTSDNLKKTHGPLYNGIRRSSKTLVQWANRLNLEHNCTPKNYYKNINNIDIEVDKLVKKYGFFPNRELLTIEGKNQIPIALRLYHNTTQIQYLKTRGIQIPKRSKLETYVMKLLDRLVLDTNYVDNKYKALEKYGVCTKNPKTGCYLEIDRYYIDQRIAIEIQGEQHYKATAYWNADRVLPVIERDKIKRQLLINQDVTLIEIKYNQISVQTIYNQLLKSGMDKLCEYGETLKLRQYRTKLR